MGSGPWNMKTLGGYPLDEVVSTIQKAIRRGDAETTLWWVAEMNASGFGAYVWRRLFIIVCEDVGLAEPNAPAVVAGLWTMSEVLRGKSPAREPGAPTIYPPLQLDQAAWFLCRLPKNRELADAETLIVLQRKRGDTREIPAYAKDQHTASGRAKGQGLYHFDGGTGPEFGRYIENAVEIDGDQWQKKFYEEWTPPADRRSRVVE